MKRYLMIVLALIVIITGFPLAPPTQVEAASGTDSGNNGKPYQTGAWFEDGKFIFATPNKKATSSIRYRTYGFILRADDPTTAVNEGTTCNDGGAGTPTAQCTPLKNGTSQYIKLSLSDPANGSGDDYNECQYIKDNVAKYASKTINEISSDTGCTKVGVTNEIVVYRFEAPADVVMKLMRTHPIFQYIKHGQTIYVNSLLQVYGPTSNNGKVYEQNRDGGGKDGIYDAESWANPKYFRGYYDNPVPFESDKYPITVRYKKESDRTDLKTPVELPTKYVVNDATQSVPVPDTVTDASGNIWTVACSYVQATQDNTHVDCSDNPDEPYWVRDKNQTSRNPSMSLGGTDVVILYEKVDCKCTFQATIPNKSTLEGPIPKGQSVIGKIVPMPVTLQQSPSDLADWKEWVKDKSNFTIKVRLWRTDNLSATPNSNTGNSAIWKKTANAPTPATDSNATYVMPLANQWSLLSYLGGETKAIYNDDLMQYPIDAGTKVSFRYNASVTITAKDKAGNVISKSCTGGPSTTLTWTRPPDDPPPLTGEFVSTPKYWSEIKEGSPQTAGTSSNETFDAMSGTVTTRNLYFASGGSEFMVDVQVEYVPKVTKQRTYRTYFTPVVNGWAMSPITGSRQKDSPPSAPTARTMTDDAGASYTEVVSSHSAPYVKVPAVPCSGNPCTGGSPAVMGTEYWWVQEGYDSHQVGGYEDTWTQTVTYDYMKINKAIVWKLDKSKVDGMTTLVGTNEVTAAVKQGNPNIFYNIVNDNAGNNMSAKGRLRYSLETDQHDAVTWNEGPSDNSLANSKTGKVDEQKKFDERRAMTTDVTAISDFLILQTSTGDQAVMYFDKKSNTAKVTDQLDVPVTDFDTMWTNNSRSAAKWDKLDTIKVGSYNGQFAQPSMKYSGGSSGTVATIFDSKPAGLNRPSRPAPYFRLMETGLDIPDSLGNGEYKTGVASVFYKNILNVNPKNLPEAYSTEADADYGAVGQAFDSTYSPTHAKVNDVVIHNPVSVEYAMVDSLPNHLDQRTDASKAIGGNLQEGAIEYERVLDPDYRQNILANGDAEIVNADKTVAGWNTWTSTPGANVRFTSRTGDSWVMSGTNSFEINTTPNPGGNTGTNYIGVYYKDIAIKPNTDYKFTGNISCHRCEGYFYLDVYNSDGSASASGLSGGSVYSTGTPALKTIDFTSGPNASRVRIHIVKGNGRADSAAGTAEYVFADDLKLQNMSKQEFVAVEGVYATQEVPNPDYVPASAGTSEVFDFTGSQQTFTAPASGTYTVELWGAAGGYYDTLHGKGGYAKGDIALNAGETIYLYVGGKGGNSSSSIDGQDSNNNNGGWNGGGSGVGSAGPGGGGGTDIRRGGTSINDRIIVAGGGGGSSIASTISYGGGAATTATLFAGQNGDTSRHVSSYPNDEGGGGGGYYGGMVVHGDDPRSSYGGTSWTGNLANASMIDGNSSMPAPSGGTETGHSGNGAIRIVSPPQAEVGSPTVIASSLAGGSDNSIPSEAYMLVPKQQDPMAPIGGFTPGKFVLLDHGFTLRFPNTGNFYGNGQWGWASTTDIRGKGYVDGMDTTEWTKAKYVKFDFNVIYNNVMYKSGEWIPLDVPTTLFNFYIPLGNREKVSALVQFKSIAINGQYEDNDTSTNKIRFGTPRDHAARHSTLKSFNIDVVGRIGNMAIEDTGDFRFSNFFKQPLVPTQWFVPNVVKKVDLNKQNLIIGDQTDIRGQTVSAGTRFLDTYGLLPHLRQDPVPFPLSPEKNNIAALKKQPLRLGYNVYADIQTIGNYYSNTQVTLYYYHLDLQTGTINQVDIYMDVNGEYKPINKFGAAVPGWNASTVYANPVRLDWAGESGRRNVTSAEAELTTRVANLFAEGGGDSTTGKGAQPFGNYLYGTSQIMNLTGRNRTYIGQDNTYGVDKNPGNKLSLLEYAMQAQRWHFQYVLPSSSVAVKKGLAANQANINALRKNTGVILMAADIISVGDTYALQYRAPNNQTLEIAGTSWSISSIPYPVVAVYSASKSSADDLEVSGTH